MIRIGAAVFTVTLAVIARPTSVAAQEFPTSQSEFYAVGETFAHCSGHFAFAAEVARSNSLVDTAVSFEGMERGWRVAGMIFLVEGLDASRQTEVETLFGTMQQIEVERLRAEREVAQAIGDASYDALSGERFMVLCGPWIELQQATIRALRSGPQE